MKTLKIILAIFVLCLASLYAVNPHTIEGKWLTPEGISIVEIKYSEGQYTGVILSIHPEVYVNGAAPKDIQNEDPGLRSRSLLGIVVLSGFSYDKKKDRWMIEHIYEPERGKYFEGYIALNGKNELSVRGHVPGKKWLGKTEIWKRVEGDEF